MPGEKPFHLDSEAYQAAVSVLVALNAGGYEAFLVGGCVRDILRGEEPADYDITTNARPEHVQTLFAKTIPTGIKHGTVSVLHNGFRIEVTTYRRETGYHDARRPDRVEFISQLDEDLARRDFTVNAMAMDKEGHIRDPFGGQMDLAARIVRAVGDPEQRMREDALRILRAIRFAAQLGASIDSNTWRAVCKLNNRLSYVSTERIRDEWNRIVSTDLAAGMHLLISGGMTRFIFNNIELDAEQLLAAARFATIVSNQLPVRLAALFYKLQFDSGQAAEQLRQLRQLTSLRRDVAAVLDAIPPTDPLTWSNRDWQMYLYQHGKFAAESAFQIASTQRPAAGVMLLEQLKDAISRQKLWHLRELAVTGSDLLQELPIRQGPMIGLLLHELAVSVLSGSVGNTRQQLLDKSRCIVNEWHQSKSK